MCMFKLWNTKCLLVVQGYRFYRQHYWTNWRVLSLLCCWKYNYRQIIIWPINKWECGELPARKQNLIYYFSLSIEYHVNLHTCYVELWGSSSTYSWHSSQCCHGHCILWLRIFHSWLWWGGWQNLLCNRFSKFSLRTRTQFHSVVLWTRNVYYSLTLFVATIPTIPPYLNLIAWRNHTIGFVSQYDYEFSLLFFYTKV